MEEKETHSSCYNQSNLYKNGRGLFLIEIILNKFKYIFKKLFPTIFAILNNNSQNQFVITRSIFAFFIGTFYSFLIFYFSIYGIEEINLSVKVISLSMMVTIISIAMTCFAKFRCIITLCLVNFVSSNGKIILTSYILIGVLNGPIINTFENAKELGDSVMCQYNLYRNMTTLSKTKFKAQKEFIKSIFDTDKKIKDGQKEISNLLNGFDKEFNTEEKFGDVGIKPGTNDYDLEQNDIKQHMINKDDFYYNKNIKRCLKVFDYGKKSCQNNIFIVKKNCHLNVCPPHHFIKPDSVCEYRLLSPWTEYKICQDELKKADYRDVGKNAEKLNKLNEGFDKNFDFSFKYKLNEDINYDKNRIVEMKTKADQLKGKSYIFFRYVEVFIRFLSIIPNYGFSLVILKSHKYLYNYLNDISYDNIYLTQYFRRVDARRFKLNKRVLFPLKKIEKMNLIYPFELHIFNYLRPSIKIKLGFNLLLILIVCITLLFDYILYDFMSLVNEYLIVNYAIESYMMLNLNLIGDGLVAKLFKLVIKNIHKEQYSSFADSSARCAPKINPLNYEQMKTLLIQLVLFLAIVLFEIYIKRLNRCVCAFFYRRQEKKRVIWLYNDLLKKRIKFLQHAKKKILHEINHDLHEYEYDVISSIIEILWNVKPLVKLCIYLRLVKSKCIICDEKTKQFKKCNNCNSIYCFQCYLDVNKICLLCNMK